MKSIVHLFSSKSCQIEEVGRLTSQLLGELLVTKRKRKKKIDKIQGQVRHFGYPIALNSLF
jgi:hypothetical protein